MINILRCSLAVLLSAIISLSGNAQSLSSDVELENQAGSDAVFRVSVVSPNVGTASEDLAIRSVISALLNTGVEGLNNGQPMLSRPEPEYEGRLASSRGYLMMMSGTPSKVGEMKFNGMYKLTYQVPLNINSLRKDLEKNKFALNHAWIDSKKELSPAEVAIRPVIVVIPEITDGEQGFEELRDLVNKNPAYKTGINKLIQLFGDNGFVTRDFRTAIENSKTSDLLREGAQTDVKTMVVQELPGDIVVKMDIALKHRGNANGANVTVRAVERQTEAVLSNETFTSGFYHISDPAMIVDKALDRVAPDFFSKLGDAFNRMASEGRSMILDINLGEAVSDWDFDLESPADGSDFKEELYEWLRANSYRGIMDMSVSSSKYIKANLNIPLWDTAKNRSYRIENFTSDLKKFLNKKLGGEYNVNVTAMGQKLSIMIE